MSQHRRDDVIAVHSIHRFVISVPDLDQAEHFYAAFGLDVRRHADRLDLHTVGHPHCWGQVYRGSGARKKLEYLAFGAYADDLDTLKARARAAGALMQDRHPLGSADGFWLRDPDGVALQVLVADKVTPTERAPALGPVVKRNPVGADIAPMRSEGVPVRPVRLSHVLVFCTDVDATLAFYERMLGLRLSDRSVDLLAFMHGAHTSDHHLLAMAKSEGPGLHHTSWTVQRLDEVGMGMEQMLAAGYTEGWGVGRHVIGSNYFYYARDPWGSFAEFSFDIDFIDAQSDWPAGNYPPEDGMYLWGPAVPDFFVQNHELAAQTEPVA